MTIHEFANSQGLKRVEVPDEFHLGKLEYFPPGHTQLLMSDDGLLCIAINWVNQRFAAERNGFCVMGFADVELSAEQLKNLSNL